MEGLIIRNSKVSIIVNVYNEENNIGDFLNSLLAQTFKDFELIIVDDGSTDSTMSIVEKYATKLDIRTVSLEHVGLIKARNEGIKSSDKEIVITLDADEIIDEHCVEKLVDSFKDSDVVAVGGFIDSYGSNWMCRGRRTLSKMVFSLEKRDNQVTKTYGGCSAYRRTIIEELGGLGLDNAAGDTSFSIKMHKAGLNVMLRDDAIVYHKEPGNLQAVIRRELKQGDASFNFCYKYKMLSNWKVLSRFFPLVFLSLIVFSWKLAFLGFFSTFLITLFLVKNIKSRFSDKIYGWIVLTYTSFWWSLGFLGSLVVNFARKVI